MFAVSAKSIYATQYTFIKIYCNTIPIRIIKKHTYHFHIPLKLPDTAMIHYGLCQHVVVTVHILA